MFKWILGGPTKDFPFEVKEEIVGYEGKAWRLNRGSRKSDGSPVTVLSFDSKKNSHRAPCASNYFKRLRTLRHPNILTYIDGFEDETTGVTIVTEAVKPLTEYLQEIAEYPSALIWGIYQLTKALSFLKTAKMIHGNLTIENIFVTQAGDWKLGGFDLISPFADTTSLIRNSGFTSFIPNKYKSPEYVKNNWTPLDEDNLSCIDVWMLACLIYELYNGKYEKMEELKRPGNIPKDLLPVYQKMLHSNPDNRIEPAEILTSSYFQNNYVETCLFLEEMALKDAAEKEKFFRKLESHVETFPISCSKYKILPHLVNALDLGTASSKILVIVLKIAKQLSNEEYNSKVTPSVIRWFASNDRAFRSNLLQNLDQFIEYLPNSVVDGEIFNNICGGFMDTSPGLRELTVKSMMLLVPKLSEKTITTQMLKYFAKLQMDEEPGIRTNTTICLAKIAGHIPHATRQKVLVPAFCRSLKDPYSRARVAGVMSFMVTQNYYTKEDMAGKIVPNLSLCMIDPEKEGAFQAVQDFVNKLKTISETGKEENIAEASMVQPTVLSWLSKRIYGGEAEKGQSSAPNGSNTSPIVEKQQEKTETPTRDTPTRTTTLPSKGGMKVNKKETSSDGWGEDDDDDFFEKPQNKNPPPKKVEKKTTAPSSDGWGDDDDDDFAEFGSTTKKSTRELTSSPKKVERVTKREDKKEEEREEKKEEKKGKGGWSDDEWEDFEVTTTRASKLDGAQSRKTKKGF
ncbi:hypothetical protein PROFUN_11742 [Planoprotostelium fungivorum]|uniref:Protein kinase domain-containing protein n=1 Tax=Planoprotostelium fungivorum TaxID=1890364 RepID=A0A2P6MYF4_9EUKA|nr:hypothetical protein PROFUN_11742 [Planoprotostelium fungivorum]